MHFCGSYTIALAWSALTGKQRASYIRALALELKNNEDEIIETEVIALGKPRGPTAMEQGWSADYLETLAVGTCCIVETVH